MPIPTPEERVGSLLLGKYRLERMIGRGGMGVLYAARHLGVERAVAVKVMQPRGPELALHAKRFLHEAQTASAVQHPHVTQIFDVDKDDNGIPFIVMELLEGETLAARIARLGQLSIEDSLTLLLPVMGALALAHDRGILHRDIKPENIFVVGDPHGRTMAKLLDFGLAKATTHESLTSTGAVLGTPAFMAPEQVQEGGMPGPSIDVWAMGATLFCCLTGRPPFRGNSPAALLWQVVSAPVPRLGELMPELPRQLAAACDRALERRLDLRYADMRSFARALYGTGLAAGLLLPDEPDSVGLPALNRTLPGLGEFPTESVEIARAELASTDQPTQVAAPQTTGDHRQPWRKRSKRVVVLSLVALGLIAGWLLRERPPSDERLATPAPAGPQSKTPNREGGLALPSVAQPIETASEPSAPQRPSAAPLAGSELPPTRAAQQAVDATPLTPRPRTRRSVVAAPAQPAAPAPQPAAAPLRLELEWQ